MTWIIHNHDVQSVPWPIEGESVQCCVTSPPYWGLRDYGTDGQLGLERTPEEYVEKMVAVFREVRRVLRKDGTIWLNLGDCYASDMKGSGGPSAKQLSNAGSFYSGSQRLNHGLKPKDIVGIPWRVAFALQADGWWLRSDIVWAKPNPMPESIRDRPTRAHEYIFLLTKSARYFYDQDAIAEPAKFVGVTGQDANGFLNPLRFNGKMAKSYKQSGHGPRHAGFSPRWEEAANRGDCSETRNARTVWSIATEPYPGAHFATFPTELARRCILAGTRPNDTVLDPFSGSGTTLLVADMLGRNGVGLELNPEYVALAEKRIAAPRTDAGKARAALEDAGQETLW